MLLFFLLIGVLAETAAAQAQSQPAAEGSICLGSFNIHGARQWGFGISKLKILCPAQHSAYGTFIPTSAVASTAENVWLKTVCCPLPKNDILTGEHVTAGQACPEDFVATGSLSSAESDCEDCVTLLRCTKININRYQLSPSFPGQYWGYGFRARKETHRVLRASIPAAIRFGMARHDKFYWHEQGCIGYPFGSLLTEKHTRMCYDLRFRQLQYRGLPGDPPQGTPVQMFPVCSDVSSLIDHDATCVNE